MVTKENPERERKERLRLNKKHFFIILKSFQFPKIVKDEGNDCSYVVKSKAFKFKIKIKANFVTSLYSKAHVCFISSMFKKKGICYKISLQYFSH